MRLHAIAIAATLLFASSAAFAVSNTVVAKLETPMSESKIVIAGSAAWTCQGDACSVVLDRKTPMVRDCRVIAREVGRIASFKVGTSELDAAGIAACNASAKQ
jgi:hypothetical protein